MPADDASEITEKIKILATDDEKIKSFGEMLTNDSSREILQLLFNEEMTAARIAQRTEISLQLVRYHLNKLQDLGIVKVVRTEKNSKSQDMKVYSATKFSMVIVPPKLSEKTRESKLLVRSFRHIYKVAGFAAATCLSGLLSLSQLGTQMQPAGTWGQQTMPGPAPSEGSDLAAAPLPDEPALPDPDTAPLDPPVPESAGPDAPYLAEPAPSAAPPAAPPTEPPEPAGGLDRTMEEIAAPPSESPSVITSSGGGGGGGGGGSRAPVEPEPKDAAEPGPPDLGLSDEGSGPPGNDLMADTVSDAPMTDMDDDKPASDDLVHDGPDAAPADGDLAGPTPDILIPQLASDPGYDLFIPLAGATVILGGLTAYYRA